LFASGGSSIGSSANTSGLVKVAGDGPLCAGCFHSDIPAVSSIGSAASGSLSGGISATGGASFSSSARGSSGSLRRLTVSQNPAVILG